MPYAEVSVNSPFAGRRTYSYAIPARLALVPGHAVWVPFGEKVLQGVVLEICDVPGVAETKDIIDLIETEPLVGPQHLELARWMSDYYLSPLFDAVSQMLPPGFIRRVITSVLPTRRALAGEDLYLDEDERRALEYILQREGAELGELEKLLGKRRATRVVPRLVAKGLASRSYCPEAVKVRPKKGLVIELGLSPAEAEEWVERLRRKHAERQGELLSLLLREGRALSLEEVRKEIGLAPGVIKRLEEKGLVATRPVEVRREPIDYRLVKDTPPPILTPHQQEALAEIRAGLGGGNEGVYLLHGVTGSGKTEVYLQALAEVVRQGRQGIVLVPEISLTTQTIERFASRFPRRVAVLHSRLSLGEQFDEWHRIHRGDFDVVIGPRSAIFAPLGRLGLIVIDEEHEWSYKQQEQSPRYHAREVALKLAELTRSTVILGSATPSVESYFRAQFGEYHLVRLPERLSPYPGAPLPDVEVVDMREELKEGNRSIFSRSLRRAIGHTLSQGEQLILFYNRRGTATFIQCRHCGFVMRCRRCDATLVYHADSGSLICHQCNYRREAPRTCPNCASTKIKFLGLGTEGLEQETKAAFPIASILRWDSDTARGRHAHEEILRQFRGGEADILIGTQMVAKGLDIPMVTLVGVINADTSLFLPDFRAGERTFQLLTQVAGRAGRGPAGGRVIIQTYSPQSYVIRAAAKHSYESFYQDEMAFRHHLSYPPFSALVSLTYSHTNNDASRREAERMKGLLEERLLARGLGGDIRVIGPAPAFTSRLRGHYRWQILLKGTMPRRALEDVPVPEGWVIDVEPLGPD